MSLLSRLALLGLILVLSGPIAARNLNDFDPPSLQPAAQPPSPQELNTREARRLYGQGLLLERKNRLIEAVKAFEAARKLDPDSAAIARSLFSLYLALDRLEDALECCRKVLSIDPHDAMTSFQYARQLRILERIPDALAVLYKATESPKFLNRADLAAQIRLDLANLHEHRKEWPKAEASLRALVKILEKPSSLIESGRYTREEVTGQLADTWEQLGRVSLQMNQLKQADEAFEKAKKLDSGRGPRLGLHLAKAYIAQGKYAEALAPLEVYLASLPPTTEGYELRIEVQKKLDRISEILPKLEASVERDPNNAAIKLLLARECTKVVAKRGRATILFAELLEHHVTPEVYRGWFDLLTLQGAPGMNMILDRLDKALVGAAGDEAKPGNTGDARRARAILIVLREDAGLVRQLLPQALSRIGARRLAFQTRGVLATLAARTKLNEEAERLYRSCLERGDGAREQEAEVYSGLLRVLRSQNKQEDIIKLCEEGLKNAHQTNRVLFHLEMVWAYIALDKHEDALLAAESAVADSGKNELLRSRRTKILALSQAGKHEKALEECQAMLKEYTVGGELRDVRYTMSSVYQAMGKLEESEKQLQMILDSDPNDATACNDLGYGWADRNKNLEEAERLIRKALELDKHQRTTGVVVDADAGKENAAYVDSLGWVLFRRGKLQEAKEALEKATTLLQGEDDPTVWDHLGDVYAKMKENVKAHNAWKQSLKLYETTSRRKNESRIKDIQEKMRLVKP